MKYGNTLQRRSIPAWRAHNIDYDEIKRFIKTRTSPGKNESIAVPGCEHEKLAEFDRELSEVFIQQHERINLFVKSKVGEIKRRLEHAKRQLRQLSSRKSTAVDRRIPIARLERYSSLENDVVKVGNEIRSLARFTSTNRTAFRKLIKKARKWTHSEQLCSGFQTNTLNGGESFLQLNFGPLLDDYAQTLSDIRHLYESRVKRASITADELLEPSDGASTPQRLQAALKLGSKVDFDTAIATIPLGEAGGLANYFVHPEYAVELQVLLLQHLQTYAGRSRHNSLAASPTSGAPKGPTEDDLASKQDYYMLVADDVDRFAKVEGTVTINEREHGAGHVPQRAKYLLRWTNDEDAVLASKSDAHKISTAGVKRKHVEKFFEPQSDQRRGSEVAFAGHTIAAMRDEMAKESNLRSLYKICSARQRFTGIGDGARSVTLATLDTHISFSKGSQDTDRGTPASFPFAVLQVRTEGVGGYELIKTLDDSHLVERVMGFSLQYHALWQTCRPDKMSAPFWIPILSRDIRKLPPAQTRHDSVAPRSSGTASANQQSPGTNSIRGLTDETTAVESPRPPSAAAADLLETPPLKAFRKKRRRKYPEEDAPPQQRYWNEYDHPEDGDGENSYVIYIDPNERSTLDKLFDSIGNLFSPRISREPDAEPPSPASPKEDESSSEEDEESALGPLRHHGYGTQHSHRAPSPATLAREHHRATHVSFPQITSLCLVASIAILAITFILATTSKHKYVRTVDAAIVFAIVCSLIFAGVGFVTLMGQRAPKSWGAVGVAVAVLLLDAICSGGLLAWMLG